MTSYICSAKLYGKVEKKDMSFFGEMLYYIQKTNLSNSEMKLMRNSCEFCFPERNVIFPLSLKLTFLECFLIIIHALFMHDLISTNTFEIIYKLSDKFH